MKVYFESKVSLVKIQRSDQLLHKSFGNISERLLIFPVIFQQSFYT